MVSYTDSQIKNLIYEEYQNKKIALLSPIIKSRKGHYRELFESLMGQGFTKVRVNNELLDIKPGMKVDRYKTHDIELVVDRFIIKQDEDFKKRFEASISTAMHYGQDTIMVLDVDEKK